MSEKKKVDEKKEEKVAVFICHCGGNISDVVDCEGVAEWAKKLPNVVHSEDYPFMCSDPGQKLIEEALDKGATRAIVAACSPRLHELTFQNVFRRKKRNPYYFEHVNIREQVSWSHPHTKDEATEKSKRLVASGVAKVSLQGFLEPPIVESTKRTLVVGGGLGGLRAAKDLADKNVPVVLVEKSPFLGGRVTQLDTLYPKDNDAKELIHELIEEVLSNELIAVHTNSEVTSFAGSIGNYDLTIKHTPRGVTSKIGEKAAKAIEVCPEEVENEYDYGLTKRKAIYQKYPGSYPNYPAIDWTNCTKCGKCAEVAEGITLENDPTEQSINVGGIILATGFKPYEPYEGEYGFGLHPNVITLPQLIRYLADNPSKELIWNGKKVERVSLIHCVGSRHREDIDKPLEDGSYNFYCSRYCCTATLHMANELKDKFPDIHVFELYKEDIRAYGWGYEDYYTAASEKNVRFFSFLGENLPTVEITEKKHPLSITVTDRLTFNETMTIPTDLIVLAVGMMPEEIPDLIDMMKVPQGAEKFLLSVHPKLRPVEAAVDGIFLGGTVQAPMTSTETAIGASGAAAKAAILMSKDVIELQPYVAEVDEDLCKGHMTCLAACSYIGAIFEVEGKQKAGINAALCKGCGTCVPACPEGAIQIKGWTLDQYKAQVKALAQDPSEV
ncbi:MAG: CoB--CoM heterodisulfide reductase iron-sulfur subunit A family protein [Candidatus Kariarchaeaceae archaeon]